MYIPSEVELETTNNFGRRYDAHLAKREPWAKADRVQITATFHNRQTYILKFHNQGPKAGSVSISVREPREFKTTTGRVITRDEWVTLTAEMITRELVDAGYTEAHPISIAKFPDHENFSSVSWREFRYRIAEVPTFDLSAPDFNKSTDPPLWQLWNAIMDRTIQETRYRRGLPNRRETAAADHTTCLSVVLAWFCWKEEAQIRFASIADHSAMLGAVTAEIARLDAAYDKDGQRGEINITPPDTGESPDPRWRIHMPWRYRRGRGDSLKSDAYFDSPAAAVEYVRAAVEAGDVFERWPNEAYIRLLLAAIDELKPAR